MSQYSKGVVIKVAATDGEETSSLAESLMDIEMASLASHQK